MEYVTAGMVVIATVVTGYIAAQIGAPAWVAGVFTVWGVAVGASYAALWRNIHRK